MGSNTIKTRIQLKNDTEQNWNKASHFIPLKGEIIIYSADESHPFSRLKVGDGTTFITELPFISTENVNDSKIFADTTVNWQANSSFIPAKGDIIIFFDKETIIKDGEEIVVPGVKIGDGKAYNIDLPFVGDDIIEQLFAHISDSNRHVTLQEKKFWNNKINCEDIVGNETLIFNRE